MALQKIFALYTHSSTREHPWHRQVTQWRKTITHFFLPNLAAAPKPGADACSGTNQGPQSSAPEFLSSMVMFGVDYGIYQHLKTR